MTWRRWLGAFGVVAVVAGLAYVAQENETSATRMAAAANQLLGSLSDEQKQKATFAFDNPHRTAWYFTPQQDKGKATRKGLALKDMDEKQRKLVIQLLEAGTSKDGKDKALDVISLEAVLRELEKGRSGIVRDPDWYFVSVFGKPGPAGKWGWRLEGHHLSLNFTFDNGKVVSATPCFYGANPREILAGDRKGHRALPSEEDLARELVKSLFPDQKKTAILSDKPRAEDIKEGNAQAVVEAEPKGLAFGDMSTEQRKLLFSIVQTYTNKLARDIGHAAMAEIRQAGFDKVRFAWWGGLEPRQPHVYRIQGPTFVLEYVCTQNDANHIHSCWRSLKGDFGLAAK